MKVLAAILAAVLFLAICSPAEARLHDAFFVTCCFHYTTRRIPRSLITSIERTSSRCSMPGVILITKKGHQVCADPQAPWVQALVQYFERQ